MGRARKHTAVCFFVGLNMSMITSVNFSGLFAVKPASPVGNSQGYYQAPKTTTTIPVVNQPVKL
jgi:hypothetical protein